MASALGGPLLCVCTAGAPMQCGARSALRRSAPMQRGARFPIVDFLFGASCRAQRGRPKCCKTNALLPVLKLKGVLKAAKKRMLKTEI